MLGIIIQLLISWLLVWLFERKNLTVLGLFPNRQRLVGFFLFFLVTAFCCATEFLLKFILAHQQWKLNPQFTDRLLLKGIWWNIKSVLFEELIFRGVILYILIQRIGASKAILISAIGFGIYHWFSYGIFGNISQMVIVFFITGLMGLLLAFGYAKTLSLYVSIAIHLGWNLTHNFIFSNGPIGNGIFVPVDPAPFRTNSYLLFFTVTFLPMISMLLANYFLLKKQQHLTSELIVHNS